MAKILFVEDDDFVREAISQMIEEWGYQVVVASDVEEALRVLAATKDVDALITDIMLGASTLGGYELSHRATEQFPSLRVIYTSGTPPNQNHADRSVPGSTFIQKPYREANLRSAVDALFTVSA